MTYQRPDAPPPPKLPPPPLNPPPPLPPPDVQPPDVQPPWPGRLDQRRGPVIPRISAAMIATTPTPIARPSSCVSHQTIAPVTPPVATDPSARPKIDRNTNEPTRTTPKRNGSNSARRSVPPPHPRSGSGSGSPSMTRIICPTPAA